MIRLVQIVLHVALVPPRNQTRHIQPHRHTVRCRELKQNVAEPAPHDGRHEAANGIELLLRVDVGRHAGRQLPPLRHHVVWRRHGGSGEDGKGQEGGGGAEAHAGRKCALSIALWLAL